MTPRRLYHVRAFAVRGGNPSNGRYIATVEAKQPGVMFQPDPVALREALPSNWRKAFDKQKSWSMAKSPAINEIAGTMRLYGSHGIALATLHCFEITPAEAYQVGVPK